MKHAQKPDHISLNTLINRLKDGRFVIPDFQREFEWKPWDIRDLMRSIFLDYYIGSLLLWKGKSENFDALSCEAVYGHNGNGNPEHIVLDGQQRLTAIYYSFLAPDAPLPNRTNRFFFFINVEKFMEEEYDSAFNYDWLTRRWSKILDEPEAQFEAHVFPLSVIGAGGFALYEWVTKYKQYWDQKAATADADGEASEAALARNHAANAEEFGNYLKEITEEYQISYIELDRDIEVDKVCDIFTQINSRGVRLDVFDLINALIKPKGLQLKQMWRDAASRLEFVDTEKMNVYLLQVMSILRQGYCSPKYLYFLLPGQEKPIRDPDGTRRKEILINDSADFEERWNVAVKAMENAINLLRHPQEFGAISSRYFPYVSILPVFAALQIFRESLPANKQLDAQRKIRHWYWASVFTNRYSGSVESTSARDFLDIKAWCRDDDNAPALLREFETRYRTLDLRKETRRGTSVYNGVFNLLVLQGARDWMTGNVPQHGDLDDHHIVPASWGVKELKGNLVHTILNRTPLSSDTNRNVIREKLPNVYLPELMNANGEKNVRAILESHFISPAALSILLRDPFTAEDFEEFISERQRTIQEAIQNLLIKERLDLAPQLRELDEQVEAAELGLRRIIAQTVGEDASGIPSHILQKADERIQKSLRKNASLDAEHLQTLDGRLEYCDLRELQDAIVSKALWPQFAPRFASKGTLTSKFDQLAELRNAIRHSRSVDQVSRMEGEAAILWFQQVLAK